MVHALLIFYFQASSWTSSRWIVTDRHMSFATKIRFLNNFDVTIRNLLPSVVGPPAATHLSCLGHDISHDWNARSIGYVEPYSEKQLSVVPKCIDMGEIGT